MCRCMLVLRNDMSVPVGRDVRAGMTQPGLDRLCVHAVGEQQCGLGMTKLVEFESVESATLALDSP